MGCVQSSTAREVEPQERFDSARSQATSTGASSLVAQPAGVGYRPTQAIESSNLRSEHSDMSVSNLSAASYQAPRSSGQSIQRLVAKRGRDGSVRIDKRQAGQTKLPYTVIIGSSGERYELLKSLNSKDVRELDEILKAITPKSTTIKVVGNDHHIRIVLGEGAYGTYKLIRRLSDKHIMAVKKIGDLEAAGREISSHKKLPASENIVSMRDYAIVPDSKGKEVAYIVKELVIGIDLKRLIATYQGLPNSLVNNIPTNRCRGREAKETIGWARDVCRAVDDLHKDGKCTLDIKPENFMVHYTGPDRGRVKMTDVGTIHELGGDFGRAETSPRYVPPEGYVVNGKTFNAFSVGLMIWEIIGNRHPLECPIRGQVSPLYREAMRLYDEEGESPNAALLSPYIEDAVKFRSKVEYAASSTDLSLENIALRMMHYNPEERLDVASALILLTQLGRILNEMPS